jgi:carbonic anhydrase
MPPARPFRTPPSDTSQVGRWPERPTLGIMAVMFDDLLDANRRYQESFSLGGLQPTAKRGLAVVTCMDSRIEPLAMLGIRPGDAKIFRNAGARVTDDVLRSLVLAVHLLGVDRICLVQHTGCAMTKYTESELREVVSERAGADASGWEFATIADQHQVLHDDLARIRSCELIPAQVTLGGFIYDVDSGGLAPVDQP